MTRFPIEPTEIGDQHVIPGAERSEAQARQILTDRQRAELEARRRQSKIRGRNDGDPGPLFSDQPELF